MATDRHLCVAHRITGYAAGTGLLVEHHDLPASLLSLAKRLAKVGADDPEALGSYPIQPTDVALVSRLLGRPLRGRHCEYFLEAFMDAAVLTDLQRRVTGRNAAFVRMDAAEE